jgi:endonuclease G, mitochondrial
MVKLTPLQDRKRHVMREAARRWADRPRGQQVRDQLAAFGGERAGFDTPLREQQFAERTTVLQQAAELRATHRLPIGLERKIGATLDFIEHAPSDPAKRAGRPVARIVDTCDPAVQATGFATAFLVSPRLLLTNWHVFDSAAAATGAGANLFYEKGERNVAIG